MKYFEEQENHLVANFSFAGFTQALGFLNQCAVIFEKHNHHPDIGIYDYKHVNITSTTHDAEDTVTDKDRAVAEEVEELYEG